MKRISGIGKKHWKLQALLVAALLFFEIPSLPAQDMQRVDAIIQLYPERVETAEELSRFISRDFETEEEKVRAIYSWIVHNIAYEPEEYKQFNFNFTNYRERNEKEERAREKLIQRTLQNGIAVCEGYAMVFEKLCELQGINSYLVRGDVKTNFADIGRSFKKIHMWNVVTIDGKSYLFDPTWGAGTYRDKFYREPNWFYYKTPPELFIKTHYPHQYEDALLSEVIAPGVFSEWPLIIEEALPPHAIETPASGVIPSETASGEIAFSLLLPVPVAVSYSYGGEKKKVDTVQAGKMTAFSVPIELGGKHLLIYFNDKPALGYRIE